jgi:hypothetical protein
VGTVRDWHAGKLPGHSQDGAGPFCPRCSRNEHHFDELGRDYVYLLGLNLGDGNISAHSRGVFKLRIVLDVKYPAIVDECAAAMATTVRTALLVEFANPATALRSTRTRGPGHASSLNTAQARNISAAFGSPNGKQSLAERRPEVLMRGLIHSDGCRFINTGRGGWRHPRYLFSNVSSDITSIFCTACDCLGLRWTAALPSNESKAISIYVSRKDDVARMDEFVGPKA